MFEMYITISLLCAAVVALYILGDDLCRRFEWFGMKMDSKFGSAVTGILFPFSLAAVVSVMPFVNLLWVLMIGFEIYSRWNNK